MSILVQNMKFLCLILWLGEVCTVDVNNNDANDDDVNHNDANDEQSKALFG